MTPKQHKCLVAVRDLTVDGVCPTYEQLRQHLGFASKSTVHRLLLALETQGLIRRWPGEYRNIEIRQPAALSDADIARMSEADLYALQDRVEAALLQRGRVSQAMRDAAV